MDRHYPVLSGMSPVNYCTEEYGHSMAIRDLVKHDLTLLAHRHSVLSRDTGLNRLHMSLAPQTGHTIPKAKSNYIVAPKQMW